MALCVCAYNEEATIKQKVENLLLLKRGMPDLDLLIYVDASTDKTSDILRAYQDDLKIIFATERHGKTHGMNLLVKNTNAEIVVFSDANVFMAEDSLKNVQKYFSDSLVGCVCGHLIYKNKDASVTAKNGSLYWRLEEWIKRYESETGSVMGADGSLFAIRRSLHAAPPDDIIDDMYISFRILCDGYRVVHALDVVAYEDTVTSMTEEYRRKIRIACQAFNTHRLLWPFLRRLPPLDLYKYMAHKFLRWFVIYWLFFFVVFFEVGMAVEGHLGLGIILMILSVASLFIGALLAIKPFQQLLDILVAFMGTGFGVYRSLRGDRFQTWSPATSIRERKR